MTPYEALGWLVALIVCVVVFNMAVDDWRTDKRKDTDANN